MALGKYSRVDGRKSSSGYCSTVTIVVFVALCLVGVWMMTSSSVVPVQTSEVSQNKNDAKAQATEINAESKNDATNDEDSNTPSEETTPTDEGKQKQFEDNPGDLPDDATKGDNNVNSNQVEKNETPDESEKNTEEKPEAKKDNTEEKGDGSKDESENVEKNKVDGESKVENQEPESGETKENNSDNEKSEEGSDKSDGEKGDSQIEEKVDNEKDVKSDQDSTEKDKSDETFPSGAQSELSDESTTENSSFKTQSTKSKNEKETQKSSESENKSSYSWKVCKTTAGPDYIPCLDNLQAIKKLPSTKHYEHRERHCPENPPTCLVPLPEGYQRSIEWPTSREKV